MYRHSSDGIPPAILTIPGAIAHHARLRSDDPALISERRVLTWRGLHDVTHVLATSLRALGVTPRDRVAFHCSTPVIFDDLITIFGMMSACAVVMIDSALPLAGRQRLIERATPLAIVSPEDLDATGLPSPVWPVAAGNRITSAAPIPGRTPAPECGPTPGAIAAVLTSSGSTAEPKLIPVRHETLIIGAQIDADTLALTPADRMLHLFPPQFGLFGMAFMATCTGGSTLVADGRPGMSDLALANLLAPTWTCATPVNLARIADHLAATIPGPSTTFRAILTGGAPASPRIRQRITSGFRAPLFDFYGATEAYSLASGGRITGEIRIADDGNNPLPPGREGEIQARGPLVFSGYLDDPDLTAAVFTPDGWFRTGDVGRIDPDDRLAVLGRRVEQINRGGLKISPLEIESAILAHPAVAEALVCAIPHASLGQDVAMAVVPHAGETVSRRELRRWLLERLQAGKVPRTILTLDALPVTGTGKASRRALAALIETRSAAGDDE